MRAARLMDVGQYVMTGALIGTAGVLLAVNLGAMYDFLQYAKSEQARVQAGEGASAGGAQPR